MQVVRRCGSETSFNINKIRAVVNWACDGLDVNSLELESSFTARFRDGMTTNQIQNNLIDGALSLCDFENPDWRYVAGRLKMWGFKKDIFVTRGYGYSTTEKDFITTYPAWVSAQLLTHSYDHRLSEYSMGDLTEAGSWINPELDKDYDYAGAVMLTDRYLLKYELPQEAFLTCALLLALPEEKENRLSFARKVYDAISQRKISLATPILANLRVPNGSLTSCFIVAMDDNLESIYREITNTARISKQGGGVGVNVSSIRATGSKVMGKDNASGGVIPWIKLLNDTAIAVNQGSKRSGAVTVGIDSWHLDLPEFLEMQTENGDPRRKAFDIFPQVIVSDEFMNRVQNNQEWTLVDPYEVKTKLGYDLPKLWGEGLNVAYGQIELSLDKIITKYKKVNAKDLFKGIMRSQIETGMPYLAFKDTINKANPNKHEGYIPQTNLCVAPETKILTDKGYFPIELLAWKSVKVWNGKEWSEVIIKRTGADKKLIKVTVADLHDPFKKRTIHCTPEHKFYLKAQESKLGYQVQAKSLHKDDLLIPTKLENGNSTYWVVTDVEDTGRISDTYCFSEPKEHKGVFNGVLTGQCTESYSNVESGKYGHCCNLVSLNLANVSETDYQDLCNTAVRILDNTIDITTPPFEDAKKHNNRYRTIGVGFMGLADWLAKRFFSYNDTKQISHLFEDLSYYCTKASAILAKERGTFDAYSKSEWSKQKLINSKPVSWFKDNAYDPERWVKLSQFIDVYGIRNSHLMAIAPNTSSSLVQGCTASILPCYSKFYYDKWSKGTVPIAPPFINDYPFGYKENKVTDQNIVVDAVSAIQQWIDTGISMELLFNLNDNIYTEKAITAKDVYDVLIRAWKQQCKAVYYIRVVQKDDFKNNENVCVSCAN